MSLPLSVMDKFDGTTKRADLESVVGTWTSEYDGAIKLIKVGDARCIVEKRDGSKVSEPSFVTWNRYFF